MNTVINLLLALYVLVSLLMILVILMQRPKSEGLGAAFGGGMTENLFGAQTTNVLTKITSWLAGIFFVLTFTLSVLYAQRSGTQGNLRRELMKGQPAEAASPAPVPGQPPATGSPAPDSGAGVLPPGGPPTAVSPNPADQAVGAVPPGPVQAPPPPAPVVSASPNP